LRQALSIALLKNPELSAFSWEVRAGEARALQSSLLPNPEVEIESENLGGSGDLKGFDSTESTIQLSQLIELAGKRSKRIRIAALERDLAEWDYEKKRIDLFTNVTRAFVDVLAAQEHLALAGELADLAKKVHNAVFERVKAGKVSPVEETKAKVALSISKIEWERTKRTLKVARKRLASFWGSTSPIFQKVEGKLYNISPIPTLEQLNSRVLQNPDIARWVIELKQREAAVELADAEKIPDLTLKGGVRRLNESNDNAFVLGVSIPIPIFNRNQGGTLEARHNLVKAEKEREAMEIQVRSTLAEVYQNLSAALSETTTLKEDVLPGSQSAFDAANEGYLFGKFSFLDVLDAQRTLFKARERYIEALADYHKSVADVERLIGESLKDIMNNS
jgi:cobalt-zinc-cadmium efflux system outer membrane protein